MKFCTKLSNHGQIEATLGNIIVKESANVKFLGLTIDTHLEWGAHSKLSSICGIIFKLRSKVKLMIYRSLAESLLSYMNII